MWKGRELEASSRLRSAVAGLPTEPPGATEGLNEAAKGDLRSNEWQGRETLPQRGETLPQRDRKINDAVAAIREQAKKAYEQAAAQARQRLSEKKFAEARAALDAVINRHAVPASTEAAKKLLAETCCARVS